MNYYSAHWYLAFPNANIHRNIGAKNSNHTPNHHDLPNFFASLKSIMMYKIIQTKDRIQHTNNIIVDTVQLIHDNKTAQ